MEGENSKKSVKYLMNQPATVHNYGKLKKSESPRNNSSPTSILRKFPHSLRHDQKHQTKIKKKMSTVNARVLSDDDDDDDSGKRDDDDDGKGNRKWRKSFGDGETEVGTSSSRVPAKREVTCHFEDIRRPFGETVETFSADSDCSNDGDILKIRHAKTKRESVRETDEKSSDYSDYHGNAVESADPNGKMAAAGSVGKLSVINKSLGTFCTVEEVEEVTGFGKKLQFPVHKSAPNLSRRSNCTRESLSKESNDLRMSLKRADSDSFPQLERKHRTIGSIRPKINRTISESAEILPEKWRNSPGKPCVRSESSVNYRNGKSDETDDDDDDDDEGMNLIENRQNATVVPADDRKDAKNRWSGYRKTVDMMPNLRNLMGKRGKVGNEAEGTTSGRKNGSVPLTTHPFPKSDSLSCLNVPKIDFDSDRDDLPMKKCETVYALTSLIRSGSPFRVEPMRPVNRLRVPPNGFAGSASGMCSRCSSLLSMAGSSRYSINADGSGFVSCSTPASDKPELTPEPLILCKLCLTEVPVSMSLEIDCCGCVFCKDCMRLYVEFEIQEGAYDISCPDAQCKKQGVVSTDEVETLVVPRMMERYRRFRLNHEVDMDRNRTWCPRAGCETVCDICPREKCAPTSVHCPTCDSDFCSNCKNPWHGGLTCEENSKKLAKEGRADFMEPGIPFDSDLIKCCPTCNVPIEKDEGCAQMMCKRCKHVFCWYCLASLDDDFLLRHYDKGPCKNKLGHTRASVIWHRTQVIGIFAGLGLLLLVASPLLLLAAPCIVCCKCRVCNGTKLDAEDDLPEPESGT